MSHTSPRPARSVLYGIVALLLSAPSPAAGDVLCTACDGITNCVPICWDFASGRNGSDIEAGKTAPASALHWSGPRSVLSGSAGSFVPDAKLRSLIQRIATEAKVDPALVQAVIRAESNFDSFAVSKKGAQGLMQLMPPTALEVGVQNSFIPEQNLRGGVAYLRQMLDLFAGDTRLALAAYNAGPQAVRTYGGVPPYGETQKYVARVLGYRAQAHQNR